MEAASHSPPLNFQDYERRQQHKATRYIATTFQCQNKMKCATHFYRKCYLFKIESH